MKFRPLHDRVVVRRLEEDEKSAGGIIIPDTAKEKPMQGELVVGRGSGACTVGLPASHNGAHSSVPSQEFYACLRNRMETTIPNRR